MKGTQLSLGLFEELEQARAELARELASPATDPRIAAVEAHIDTLRPYSIAWWRALRDLNGVCVDVGTEEYERRTKEGTWLY